uniref:Uncharacterized protein n=1 Tax=Leptobrachium leishanense TaxID=445787 RepID=A0A8C5MZG6_9ANUR
MDTAELCKLRKKLRQIENLEHLQRELNASEITKVLQKLDLRRQVEQLLALGAEVKPLVRHAPPEEEQKPTACTSQSTRRTETLKLKPQSPPTNGAPKKTLKIPETSPLQSSAFLVHHLEGHSDLVTCVLIHGTSLISGSWDTSVRVWDIPSCSEQRTLCGHTGAVTSLTLLSLGGETLDPDIWPPDEEFVASGSSDCSIIVWSLTTGRPLFSVYTYSDVTSLVNVPKTQLVISGSDGGKIEIWDLRTKQNVHSQLAYEDRVTALQLRSGLLFSGSSCGSLKVWKFSPPGSLSLIHSSDDLTPSLQGLRSICVIGETAYVANQGVCLKAVTWQQDFLARLSNHTSGTGFVDAVAVTSDDLLVASGFNVDQGHGYLNVRSAKTGDYLGTLSHPDAPRILCLAVSRSGSGLCCWVTGGRELLLWQEQPKKKMMMAQDVNLVRLQFCSDFLNAAPDTDDDDEADLWEENPAPAPYQRETPGWQWCVLV